MGLWRRFGDWWLSAAVQQIGLLDVLLTQTIPLSKVSAAILAHNSSYSRSVGKSSGGIMHNAVVIIGNTTTVNTVGSILVKVVRHS